MSFHPETIHRMKPTLGLTLMAPFCSRMVVAYVFRYVFTRVGQGPSRHGFPESVKFSLLHGNTMVKTRKKLMKHDDAGVALSGDI
jgi:hypothetical protein